MTILLISIYLPLAIDYKWISYCIGMLDLLLSYGIEVTLVFDGADLPAKNLTELERKSKRQSSLQSAKELQSSGRTSLTFQQTTRKTNC
jgi:hypothetical protein